MKYLVAISIAGSDSGGGAGIQADIKTMSALGVFATIAITAVTAQNTLGVDAIQGIDPAIVASQINAVFVDLHPVATKIGMLFSKEIASTTAQLLSAHEAQNIVLDPVMVSTSGHKLIADDAIETIKEELFPLALIATPNKFEAELLSGIKITSPEKCQEAAERILDLGCEYVLIKGGHFEGDTMIDYLYNNFGLVATYTAPKVNTRNTHGTGCTLSSAIASFLARNCDVPEAVGNAKNYLTGAITAGAEISVGGGHGSVNHFSEHTKLITI